MAAVRPLKTVIRGLPSDITVEDIRDELPKLGFPVLKVAQLIKRKTQLPMPLFQVQLSTTDMTKKITELDSLFHIKISIERYRSSTKTQECHNCQFFHHLPDEASLCQVCRAPQYEGLPEGIGKD